LLKTNIGKARLYGSDFSFEYTAAEWSSIYLNASYTAGKDIINDLYLPHIPPFNGLLGIKLNYSDFRFDLTATFFTTQKKIAEGETATPGYIYFDLFAQAPSINLGPADLNIICGVQNITNRSYRNHLSTNRGFIREEPGRNFYLKLYFSW
jgi:hemoglobin/transferrin/lactoferrin receptor protein